LLRLLLVFVLVLELESTSSLLLGVDASFISSSWFPFVPPVLVVVVVGTTGSVLVLVLVLPVPTAGGLLLIGSTDFSLPLGLEPLLANAVLFSLMEEDEAEPMLLVVGLLSSLVVMPVASVPIVVPVVHAGLAVLLLLEGMEVAISKDNAAQTSIYKALRL